MAQISRKIVEDFVGSVADDAKRTFDDILERGNTRTGVLAGDSKAGTAGDSGLHAQTLESLATLPAQVAELSRLISTLVTALEGTSDVVGAAAKATGAKKGR